VWLFSAEISAEVSLGSISNDDDHDDHDHGDGNENGKKAIGLDWQKKQLCKHITLFFCTFLSRRRMTTT